MTSSTIKTRLFFSAGHRYANPDWSEEKNRSVYGEDYSQDGMGHNFELWIEAVAENEPSQLQEVLKAVSDELDHNLLFANHPKLKLQVSSLENIGQYLWQKFIEAFAGSPKLKGLKSLSLFEGKNLGFYINSKKTALKKRYTINCVHRHHNPKLSNSENEQLYGKCANVHGHEYKFWVEVLAPINNDTGLIMPRQELDRLVKETIIAPYDKSFLNEKIGNTSGEIIIEHFYQKLRQQLASEYQLKLSLHETRKNSFFTT